jgi:hypothetical protein
MNTPSPTLPALYARLDVLLHAMEVEESPRRYKALRAEAALLSSLIVRLSPRRARIEAQHPARSLAA